MNKRPLVKVAMSPREFEMIKRIADGNEPVARILWNWCQFRQREAMFRWCIENHLTGRQFLMWHNSLTIDLGINSILGPVQHVIMHLEKQKSERAILVGPDFQPS